MARDASSRATPHNPPEFQQLRDAVALLEAASKQQTRLVLNFARLRQMVSIRQVLEHIGWHPRSTRGPQWRGACPIHEAPDSPSRYFAVHTDKNVYCCHRCGHEGNALDLWGEIHGQSAREAGWDLIDTFSLEPPLLED